MSILVLAEHIRCSLTSGLLADEPSDASNLSEVSNKKGTESLDFVEMVETEGRRLAVLAA